MARSSEGTGNIKAVDLKRGRGLFYNGRQGVRQLFSKTDLQYLSLILAIVMSLASVPPPAGLIIASRPSHPELTINICQPLQMFDPATNTLLARPASVLPEFVLRDQGANAVKETLRLVDCKIAPDTPPPKRPV